MSRVAAGRTVRVEVGGSFSDSKAARGTAAGATAAPRPCCELRVSLRAGVGPAGGLVGGHGVLGWGWVGERA